MSRWHKRKMGDQKYKRLVRGSYHLIVRREKWGWSFAIWDTIFHEHICKGTALTIDGAKQGALKFWRSIA